MDTRTAVDHHVKKKLEDSFGKSVAMLIVMSATSSANVPIVQITPDEYRQLVTAIANDERVINMWGAAGARAQLDEWIRLVD